MKMLEFIGQKKLFLHLQHWKMSEETGYHCWHDLLFYWLVLRVEVEFSQILAANSLGAGTSSNQRTTEIDETNVSDRAGE